MGLSARWIVDPTDHSGRRLIAVWSAQDTETAIDILPVWAEELVDEEWPRAS